MMEHPSPLDEFCPDPQEAQLAELREPGRQPEERLDLLVLDADVHNAFMEFPAEASRTRSRRRVRSPASWASRRPSFALQKRELSLILTGAALGLAAVALWWVSVRPSTNLPEPAERARVTSSGRPVTSMGDLPAATVRPDARAPLPGDEASVSPVPRLEPSPVPRDTPNAPRARTAVVSPAGAPSSLQALPSTPVLLLPSKPTGAQPTTPIARDSAPARALFPPPPERASSSSATSRMPRPNAGAVTARSTARSDIERVVHAYRESYNRLDARSTALVWPSVDTGALARAFRTLLEQELSFDGCEFDVETVTATVSCAGTVRYVQRIGDPTPHVQEVSWAFQLERTDRGWQIEDVTAH